MTAQTASKPLDLSQFEGHTPDAWIVQAFDIPGNQRSVRILKKDAEEEAYEWRVAGATTEIFPLYTTAPSLLSLAREQRERIAALEAENARLREALAIGYAMAEDSADYAAECLGHHLLALGETTEKNKRTAERLREAVRAAKDAQTLFESILELP